MTDFSSFIVSRVEEPYRNLQPVCVLTVVPKEGDGLYRRYTIQSAGQAYIKVARRTSYDTTHIDASIVPTCIGSVGTWERE